MTYKNIIGILDEFNISNILAMIKFQSDKLVLITNDKNQSNIKKSIENQFKDYNLIAEVEIIYIENINYQQIKNILSKYNKLSSLINITNGDRLISLNLFKASMECEIKSIYVNIDNEEMIFLDNEEKVDIREWRLDIEDFVTSSGSVMIEESTSIFDDERIKDFTNYILHNYDKWKIVSPYFKNTTIIEQNFMIKENIKVRLHDLNVDEQKNLREICNCISKFKLGNTEFISNRNIIINFKSCDFKSFIFKSGTWLEVLVYNLLKEMKYIEDVKGGLVFAWEKDSIGVKNEVDVIATNDSRLIYISCKDTNKYDSQSLNEIQVYAEKLGGDKVTKILVATQEPEKRTMLERAKEMGINVVIFDGDMNKLKEILRSLI